MIDNRSKRQTLRWQWAWIALVFLGQAVGVAAPVGAEDSTLRLRIAWGGNVPVQWTARFSVAGGELTDLSLLGRERDTPGSIWLDRATVGVGEPRPRTFDGIDVTVRAPLTATLRLDFQEAGAERLPTIELPLAELMTTTHRSAMPSQNSPTSTTLLVHRVTDDALRIHTDRKHLIFSPSEEFSFEVTPAIANLGPGSAIDLGVALLQGRSGKQEWSNTSRVSLPTQGEALLPVAIPLPDREGVYTVRLTASLPPGNRAKFWETATAEKLAERTFQLVVLAPQAPQDFKQVEWQTLLEIDPANPKWYDRLPDWTRLDRLAKWTVTPIGSETSSTATMHGTALVQLSPSRPDKPTWQAYPLPAARPGEPHVVEVDLPTDYAQQLAIEIYEPDANGKLVAVGPGSGIVVDPATSNSDKSFTTHRCLFYPRSNAPVAVVQNVSTEGPARFGKMRLRSARGTSIENAMARDFERPVAAFYDWNDLLTLTSARPAAGGNRSPADDWATFYLLAERLATTLELSGYNTAVVNVWDNGGSVFDAGDYPTTPVLNYSRLNSGATDLPPIDPLELMLRSFSRRGLHVVPSMRFNSTLVGMNARIRAQQYKTVDDYPLWRDLDGRWRLRLAADSPDTTLHYRVTHPDVASEIEGIVARLVARCATHESFEGVAFEISDDSYLAFPTSNYGITPSELAQLAKRTSADTETLAGWIENPRTVLADPALRHQWQAQRAAGTTRMMGSIASHLRDQKPQAELWLLTSDLFASDEFALRPQFTPKPLEDVYLARGLDIGQLEMAAGAEVVMPRFDVTGCLLVDAARPLELSQRATTSNGNAFAVWNIGRQLDPIRNQAFADPPLQPNHITFENTAASQADLARIAYRGATGPVIVGGTSGPANLANDNHRDLLRLLAQLVPLAEPNGKSIVEQPVAVQFYRVADQLLVTLANDSPWPVQAKVTLNVAQRTTLEQVLAKGSPPAAASFAAGLNVWPVSLAPYEVQLYRFAGTEVAATGMVVELDAKVAKQLAKRCEALERRDLNPDELTPYPAVPNPSFEEVDANGTAIGWTDAATSAGGRDGKRAARLVATNEPVSLATLPFPSPATAQAAVTAYVKVVELSDDAQLRILVEQVGTHTPPSFVPLTAERLKADHAEKDWNAYRFGVEDLPFDSTSNLRIRFELSGSGEVLIDDLKVHELVYPLRIYKESDQQVLDLVMHVKRTRQALEARQYRDCLTLLDSYWSQFVIEYLPETKVPDESLAPAAPVATQKDGESSPKLSDRVREWFRF